MSKDKNISWYARRYIERFGFHLVPIEPNRKFPRKNDWGNTCLTDPDQAESFYNSHPDWNMGLVLGPSKMCSLDIDCMESFQIICGEYGIDLDQLIANNPTIQGNPKGARIEFRVPEDTEIVYHSVTWPSKNDPTGEKHKSALRAAIDIKYSDPKRADRIKAVAKRWSRYTVFELRVSLSGKQRQDVLPPSMHPDTKQPYKWITQPREDWPTPPEWLLAIWTGWDSFKPQVQGMCPWGVAPTAPEPKKNRVHVTYAGGSVIEQFVNAHDLVSMLETYGYKKVGRSRYLSPHSGTNLPGVILFPEGNSCWIHHASDPLCSDESGKPVNAFDLFCYYEHNGDIKNAVAQAAKLLGIDRPAIQHTPPPSIPAPAKTVTHDDDNEQAIDTPAPPACRDYVSPLPWATDRGVPLKHIDNLREICSRLGVVIRYNVIKKEEEIIIPGESFSVDNQANASYAWLISECSLFKFPTDKMGDFATYLADKNQYNPVATWIDSKPWDGVSRLEEFYATVTAANEENDSDIKSLKETLLKRWMCSAIAAAFMPSGVSAAGVLVFQGNQYLGKTKWFKNLAPKELDVIQDGLSLNTEDKDSVKQCVSNWIVELGEIDSTFKRSISLLKAFLTRDRDTLRRAFARRESHFARRTVFFGSVNPKTFLSDPTGNRRYWTIECEHLDHSHTIDMQQVWAEFKTIWEAGESIYLEPAEMDQLNKQNEDFTTIDPVKERILSRLNWDAEESRWEWSSITDILLNIGIDRPTKADAMAASELIREKNGDISRRRSSGTQVICPPLLPPNSGYNSV